MFQQDNKNHTRKRKQPSSPTSQSFFWNVASSLLKVVPRPLAEWFRPSESNQDHSSIEQAIETSIPPPQKKKRYISPVRNEYGSDNIRTVSYYSATDEGFNITRGVQINDDEILNRVERWVQEPSSTMESYLKSHIGRGTKSPGINERLSRKTDVAILDPQNFDSESEENEESDGIHPKWVTQIKSSDQKHGHNTSLVLDPTSQEMSLTRSQKRLHFNSNSICEDPDQQEIVSTTHRESPTSEDSANTRMLSRKLFQKQSTEILSPQSSVPSTSRGNAPSLNRSNKPKLYDIHDQESIDWTKGQSICTGTAEESKVFTKLNCRSSLNSSLNIMKTMCSGAVYATGNTFNINSFGPSPNRPSTHQISAYKTRHIPLLKQAAVISVKKKSKINKNQPMTDSVRKTSDSTHTSLSNVSQTPHIEPVHNKNANKGTTSISSTAQNIHVDEPTQQNIESGTSVSVSTQTGSTVEHKLENSPQKNDKNASSLNFSSTVLVDKSIENPEVNKNTSESSSSVHPETACPELPKTLELDQLKEKEENIEVKIKNVREGQSESIDIHTEGTKDKSNKCNKKENGKALSELLKDEVINHAEKPKGWKCKECWVMNNHDASVCICCSSKKPTEELKSQHNCSVCKNELNKVDDCHACSKSNSTIPADNLMTTFKKSDSAFKKIVNTQGNKWECTICLIKNDKNLSKCACCEAPKPGGYKESDLNSFNFEVKSDKAFNKIMNTQADKWECSVCLVKNDNSLSKCPCCETPKSGECKVSESNFGMKKSTYNFETPKVIFKFGIPKEANIQPVNATTSQENNFKKQDTQTIATENLQNVPIEIIEKQDQSNNPKSSINTNFFSSPTATTASFSPFMTTSTPVLQSINTNTVTIPALNKSEPFNLNQANFIKTSTEDMSLPSTTNPFTMNKHSTNLAQQTLEKNVFSNPCTNSILSTGNVQQNPPSNANTNMLNFSFTTPNTANINSASSFINNTAIPGNSKELSNSINTNTGKEFPSAPSLSAGCFGAQDKITSNTLIDKTFVSNSSTNAVQSSPAFTFGIPHNTNPGNGNVFGLKTTNIFTTPSVSQPSIFASSMNQQSQIYGSLQSSNSPNSIVSGFGNTSVPNATPIENSNPSLPFISSNSTPNNIFGGSQTSSGSISAPNIFGSTESNNQTPAAVFGNITAKNMDGPSMFAPGNNIAFGMFGQPAGNQMPGLGGGVFGNANVPAADTTKNDPRPLFTPTNQQTPIIFGSRAPSMGQDPAVAVFGNSNAQQQAGNVFSTLGGPAPAPRPPGAGLVFGFGQQSSQQQPGVYNFAGQTSLPQFNMGSSPTTNTAGRRVRKAVRRSSQR